MAGSDITTYLQDRVGEHLRGVVRYHQDTRGIVVSLEPETARDLNAFTTECRKCITRD